MGLLTRIGAELYARRRLAAVQRGAITWDSLFQRGQEWQLLRDEVTNPYTQVDAVYVAVNAIAASAASVAYTLFRGEDVLEEHELYTLLDRPNPAMVGPGLIRGTLIDLELSGRAYWHMTALARSGRDRAKFPSEITLLPPSKVRPRTAADGTLIEWTYTARDGVHGLSVEEVARFHYHDPRDPLGGLAPLEAARLGYSVGWKSGKWQEKFFEHGAVPPFFISYPEDQVPTEREAQQLKDMFRAEYAGLRNAGRPMLLFRGAEPKSVAISQRDAEWMATQKLTREQVWSVFGVPPAVAGSFEDANRSNSEVQRRLFWHQTITPKLDLLRAVIQTAVLDPHDPGLRFAWDVKARLAEAIPEDVRASIEAARKLWDMGVPAAETFRVVGLDVMTAGRPWLDVGFVPMTLAPAQSVAEGLTIPQLGPSVPPPKRINGHLARQAKLLAESAAASEETLRAYLWRGADARVTRLGRAMLRGYRSWLEWLEDSAVSDLPEGRAAAGAKELPSEQEAETIVVQLTDDPRRAAIETGWQSVIAEVGAEASFDWLDPQVLKLLAEREIAIRGAAASEVARLRASLAEGLAAGEGRPELVARVHDQIAEAYTGQALTVARTETQASYAGARFLGMEDAGVARHEWLSARDARVRESHSAIDGETVALGEPFSNSLLYPLDPAGPPGEVVNCRCTALPVVEEAA